VDNEGKGQYGVEGYLDQELQGKEGLKIAKKDIQ
jgi:cell division protein FtsI/penicillin-binding protein 2